MTRIVKDIMNRNVTTIDVNDTALSAAKIMKKKKVSCLIATKNKEAAGIVTERDLVWRVMCQKRDPAKITIEDVMTSPLIAVNPVVTLEEAADVLHRNRIKKLAVVSAGRLEGIISATDLMAAETRQIKLLERYINIMGK